MVDYFTAGSDNGMLAAIATGTAAILGENATPVLSDLREPTGLVTSGVLESRRVARLCVLALWLVGEEEHRRVSR